MKYPSSLELLEFFASEPEVIDDVQYYKTCDDQGFCLTVSFNIADDSFQTKLTLHDSTVAVVCCENMARLAIDGEELHASFGFDNPKMTARILLSPQILVEWNGLRTR